MPRREEEINTQERKKYQLKGWNSQEEILRRKEEIHTREKEIPTERTEYPRGRNTHERERNTRRKDRIPGRKKYPKESSCSSSNLVFYA